MTASGAPPRLLLVTQQLRAIRSGVGTYARVVAQELARRPVRTTIATWSAEVDRDGFRDAEWIDLGEPKGFDPTPGSWWTMGRRLAAELRREPRSFDLAHFFDAREAWPLVSRGLLTDVPLVSTIHDDYAATSPRSPFGYMGRFADPWKRWAYYAWLRRVESRTYPRFTLNMVNADETGRAVADAYGLDTSKLRTITYALPPRESPPATVALEGSPSVLFAGGNYYRKGLDVLVRALALLRESAPGAVLHVAGRDPHRARIEALADALGVGDAVRFHGLVPRERMASLMAAADVFCMPSRREAQGFVYLEAMRERTPVVSCNVGGVVDIVRDGETGLAVPPEDAVRLAEALRRVTTDDALRLRLLDGGTALLAERPPERLLAQTIDVYEEVLGRAISACQPM